jgi:hypothetical protein
MKKLLIILTMFTLAFSVFAQEAEQEQAQPASAPAKKKAKKEFDVEITAGLPVHWTNAEHDVGGIIREDKDVVSAESLGLGLVFHFSRKVGFTFEGDLSFSQSLYGDPAHDSSHYSQVVGNFFMGPVFYLYNGNYLRVPFAVGAHLFYFGNDHWDRAGIATDFINVSDFQFGPAFYLGIQFHFNNNIYILARTSINYDIVRYHGVKSSDGAKALPAELDVIFVKNGFSGWGVKPVMGLGIKF